VIEWGRDYDVAVSALPLVDLRPGAPRLSVLDRIDSRSAPLPPCPAVVSVVAVKGVDESASSLNVYDVVGNVIAHELPCYSDRQGDLQKWFLWDGRNVHGRIVGMGTYLGVVKLTEEDGTKHERMVKLGVVR
jgi:hypothetical protein